MHWQLAEAKNKFSEVVNRALAEGPQFITRRKDEVVVMSRQEYEQLGKQSHRLPFGEFLAYHTPSFEELDLTRDPSTGREVDFGE